MRHRRWPILLLVLALLGLLGLGVWRARPAPTALTADVVGYLSAPGDARYARVTEPREIRFPADAGAHDAFQTEWWYYTGNLADAEGRRFGFQLTFFRRALGPAEALQARDSDWAASQIYLAHFTVTDVAVKRFHAAQRLARGAAGLAGADAAPYRVWVEDWEAVQPTTAEPGTRGAWDLPLRLRAEDGPVAIDLRLQPAKPPALHGDRGFSPKGPEPGNASYYYSFSRLEAEGQLRTADGDFAVEGLAWMDHEWSTSALAEDQVGWDWFSLQLDDGRELMAFQVRQADGGVSPESSGSLIAADGRVQALKREDFILEPSGSWRSPRGGEYPAGWRLRLPAAGLDLVIEPQLADQELDLDLRYWEGSVRVTGRSAEGPVGGYGYVELTGYNGARQALPGLD